MGRVRIMGQAVGSGRASPPARSWKQTIADLSVSAYRDLVFPDSGTFSPISLDFRQYIEVKK